LYRWDSNRLFLVRAKRQQKRQLKEGLGKEGKVMVLFIVASMIFLMLVHGYLVGRGVNKEIDFLVANRTLGPIVGACTLVATYWSGYAFLGSVGVAYQYGYSQLLVGAGWVPPVLIVVLFFANFLKKRAYEFGSLTISEYAGQVHGSSAVHFISAMLSLFLTLVFMVAQYKAMGYLMGPVLGTSFGVTVLIMGVVITIYTSLGGMKAVAYTDMVQALGMTVGAIIVVVVVFMQGSFAHITESLNAISTELVNPTTGAPYGSSTLALLLVIPYGIVGLISTPYISSRLISVKADIKWHQMALVALPIMIIWELIPIVGFGARVYLPPLDKPDMAMPMWINTFINPYIGAFITVFILMAIMSTADSVLHTISSNVAYDARKALFKRQFRESTTLLINRIVTALAGIVAILLAIYSPPYFLVFLGTLGVGTLKAALFGPVFISIFWQGNRIGALTSMIGGGGVCAWGLLSKKLGWMEAPMVADIVALILYFGVSMATFRIDPRVKVVKKTSHAI
jgi:sodium/pantothenate symporter